MVRIILVKTLRYSFRFLIGFVLFILIYLLFAYLLSRIPISAEKTSEKKEVPIFIRSTNVHTDLILPVTNEVMDWRTKVPFSNNRGNDSVFKHVGFGWGDKGFYINTPNWGELTFSTAFKAAFGLGTSALHATYHKDLVTNDSNLVRIWITKKQYRRLVEYVESYFKTSNSGTFCFIPSKTISGNQDAFYDAHGTYSLFTTCNSWANSGLKICGQKAALWAPFQSGIFCHYLP